MYSEFKNGVYCSHEHEHYRSVLCHMDDVVRNILEHHLGKRQKQKSYRIYVKMSWIRTMVTERGK